MTNKENTWACAPKTLLKPYDYKPSRFAFLGKKDGSPLYMGVELEVDDGDNINNCIDNLSKLSEYLYFKNDGSLDRGFEIVSHPATLDYHASAMLWSKVMDVCKSNGFRSHDTSTCGLHIHVNRTFFGATEDEQDLHIAKTMVLFHALWPFLLRFSRRTCGCLDRWARKPCADFAPNDDAKEVVKKMKGTYNGGRYQAINITNAHTVEFRLFRGTLNYQTFMAALQLIDYVCRYAKGNSLLDVQTVAEKDFVAGMDGAELVDYVKKINAKGGK